MRVWHLLVQRWKWLLLAVVLVFAIAIAAWWLWPKPLISNQMRQNISFAILVPQPPYNIERKSLVYDSQKKILTFSTKSSNGQTFNVTEQVEPDLLAYGGQDIYQTFVSRLGEYDEIDTAIGRVSLTKSNKLSSQTAIVVAQNTLVFVRPDHNLSKDDWDGFFNSMQTYH